MVILTNEQQVRVTVAFKTAAGNPAPVDGVPAWSASDPTVLQVIPDPGGLGATVVALGVGTALVSVTADADLGPGQTWITGDLSVQVVSAPATQAVLTAGVPEPKPIFISLAVTQMLPDGSAQIDITAQPSTTYAVEATDVIVGPWAAIGQVTTDGAGSAQFVDTDAMNHATRFYRLRWPV